MRGRNVSMCVRGRLMRMQRVEFSIRQFPPSPSPSLSYSLLALARKVSFQRFCFFPGCEFTDGQLCCCRSDCSTSITGASSEQALVSLSLQGVWAFLPWMLGPGCYLNTPFKKRECTKGRAAGDKREWSGSGREKMVMPAPRVLDVLLLYRLRGVQTQPRLSST